jgi:hypothetical protein
MDNSPVIGNNSKLNGAESTFLGQQVVLNIKKESAEMEENTVVDVESTEPRSLDNAYIFLLFSCWRIFVGIGTNIFGASL